MSQYADVSRGRIFYTVAGSGEPLILIHGNFNDHGIWNEQVPTLASHYQCIRYDLRGYGRSSTPTAAFSNVEDLKALVDRLGLGKVTLMGSSSGGSIAIDFSLAYPELVRALILIAPSINGNKYPISMMWHGTKNFINANIRTANAVHAKIGNSIKITMQGCSHLPFVEEPGEFNRHVLEFLLNSSI